MSYKTAGDKLKIYMLVQTTNASVRTLLWKNIVD